MVLKKINKLNSCLLLTVNCKKQRKKFEFFYKKSEKMRNNLMMTFYIWTRAAVLVFDDIFWYLERYEQGECGI